MKNFGKLAVLGAALAVSATYAHATGAPLTGGLIISDAPVSFSGTGGIFDLSGLTNGPNNISIVQPILTGGGPVLSNYSSNMFVDTFDSATTPTNGSYAIWNGTDTANGDTETFYVTGFGPEVAGTGGDYSIVLQGVFKDSGPGTLLADTNATDNVTFDATGPSVQEDFSLAPEPNSLMLLGTGLVGAAGMLMRRRRLTV